MMLILVAGAAALPPAAGARGPGGWVVWALFSVAKLQLLLGLLNTLAT